MTAKLRDRVLHGRERFSMTNCIINGLQSTDTKSAFGEVVIPIDEDLKLTEYAYQYVCKVPV